MATRQGKDGVVDLFKRIGAATVPFFGGLSGTFIPVSEDAGMGDAVHRGAPGYNRYLEMELHIEGEEGDALDSGLKKIAYFRLGIRKIRK